MSNVSLYGLVDALGVKITVDKSTGKFTGEADVTLPDGGVVLGVKITYSYHNPDTGFQGVILHVAGDLYVLMCTAPKGLLGMAILDASKMKQVPSRTSTGFRSPKMQVGKVFAKVSSGIVAFYSKGSSEWKPVNLGHVGRFFKV